MKDMQETLKQDLEICSRDECETEELSEEEKKCFAKYFKQAVESADLNFAVSFIEKLCNVCLSMNDLIHLPFLCHHCPLHCFQVLDSVSKNRVGRPRKIRGA